MVQVPLPCLIAGGLLLVISMILIDWAGLDVTSFACFTNSLVSRFLRFPIFGFAEDESFVEVSNGKSTFFGNPSGIASGVIKHGLLENPP